MRAKFRRIAFHESAHAMVALRLGVPFKAVRIPATGTRSDGKVEGCYYEKSPEQLTNVALVGSAGMIADRITREGRYFPESQYHPRGFTLEAWFKSPRPGDVELMLWGLRQAGGLNEGQAEAFIRSHQHMAETHVRGAWPAIVKMAAALTEKCVLTHDEAQTIALTEAENNYANYEVYPVWRDGAPGL